jgi:hypothetical protein
MGQQFPTIPDEWFPLPSSSQFLSPAASTALTVPSLPAGQPAKGAVILAELVASGSDVIWIRMDGGTVTAANGIPMYQGDWRIVYGVKALAALRVIRVSTSSVLTVSYFYFRQTPG